MPEDNNDWCFSNTRKVSVLFWDPSWSYHDHYYDIWCSQQNQVMQSSLSHRLDLEEFTFWTKTNVYEKDYTNYFCILAVFITLEDIIYHPGFLYKEDIKIFIFFKNVIAISVFTGISQLRRTLNCKKSWGYSTIWGTT